MTATEPPTPGDDLDRVLGELRRLRAAPADWDEIAARLDAVGAAAGGVRPPADHPAVAALAGAAFEARVRSRFAGPRRSGDVLPTKQTSVLPWVGLVCGGLLAAVGTLLGGGVVLAGVVVLAAGVFGIAFAGSRVAHRSRPDDDPGEEPVAIPDEVARRVAGISRLGR